MRILVTGANGMLATHTIKKLVAQGYEVQALLRDRKKYQLELHPAVNLVTADILDKEAVKKAVSGCKGVIHAAAITAPNFPDYAAYERVNVTGTKNIMEAALTEGVEKVVYVSSANTVGHGDLLNPGEEDDPVKPPFTKSLYARSKKEAEKLVRSYSDNYEVVVVNPSFMIGSYGSGSGSGRIVLMTYGKSILFYPPGGKNFVNTKDVAAGVVAALEKGTSGKKYLLTGENLTYREFFKKVIGFSGRKSCLIRIPPAALLGTAYLFALPRLFNVGTSFSFSNMKVLCARNYYNNARAKKELGIHFAPIEEGIGDAIDFFKSQKKL